MRKGVSSRKRGDKHVVEGFQIPAVNLAVRLWLHVRHVDDHCSRFRQHDDKLPAEPKCVVSNLLGLLDDPPEQTVFFVGWAAAEKKVYVDRTRDQIKGPPRYNQAVADHVDYWERLGSYYSGTYMPPGDQM